MTWFTRLFRRHTQTRFVVATKQENTAASIKRFTKHEQLARELGMQNPVRLNLTFAALSAASARQERP